MVQLTPAQVRWFRLQRSGLVQPFATPEQAASTLFGVQAQILPAAALALWNRTQSLSEAQVDARLYKQRTLVKLWGQRHTLHLYPSHEWPLLHGALAINRTWWERHLEATQASQHTRLVQQVAEHLRERESMGRSDLRATGLDLDEEHFSAWGGLFADLVRQGYACHAGRTGNEGRFAHRERWLPDLVWQPPDADMANTEILRRFLSAYGPATTQDFAYWRGVKVEHARRWFKRLEPELAEVGVERQWVLQQDLATLEAATPVPERWPVRMLYRFDPLLLAHKDKSWVTDPTHYSRVWRPAGHIEGIVLAHGKAVATWRYDRQGAGLIVTVAPFKHLPNYVTKAIHKTAPQIAHFFGLPLAEVRITATE